MNFSYANKFPSFSCSYDDDVGGKCLLTLCCHLMYKKGHFFTLFHIHAHPYIGKSPSNCNGKYRQNKCSATCHYIVLCVHSYIEFMYKSVMLIFTLLKYLFKILKHVYIAQYCIDKRFNESNSLATTATMSHINLKCELKFSISVTSNMINILLLLLFLLYSYKRNA